MKARSLWQVSIAIAPESEGAVLELLWRLFRLPTCVDVDAEADVTRARVYLEEPSDWSPGRRKELCAGLKWIRECGLSLGSGRVTARRIKREDWSESWKRHFKPLEIGRQLLIKPSWSRRAPSRNQAVMVLDPGLSFGTGQHPTTRFCLEQLVTVRKQGTEQSFLDMGTGSGILTIAAAKLGYRPVEGFDLDPEAVRIARSNASRNRVRVRIRAQDLRQLPVASSKQYDVVCANLIDDLLVAEKRRIINRVKVSGRLVLAGILHAQFLAVCRAYEGCGLELVARSRVQEWESGAFAVC